MARLPGALTAHCVATVSADELTHVAEQYASKTLCGIESVTVRHREGDVEITCERCVTEWRRVSGTPEGEDPTWRRVEIRQELNHSRLDLYPNERVVCVTQSGVNLQVWIEREVVR